MPPPFDGAPPEVIEPVAGAVDRGCRLLWSLTVMGDIVRSQEHAWMVLGVFVNELDPPRWQGDTLGKVRFDTFSNLARALCALIKRSTPGDWNSADLNVRKAHILEETLAIYESDVRRVLGKKPM